MMISFVWSAWRLRHLAIPSFRAENLHKRTMEPDASSPGSRTPSSHVATDAFAPAAQQTYARAAVPCAVQRLNTSSRSSPEHCTADPGVKSSF